MEKKKRPNRPHGYEKERTETPEHVAAPDDWRPAPAQGTFGAVRDGERAAEPEPEE